MRHLVLAFAFLVAVPAYAAVDCDGANDRIDLGTLVGFGAGHRSANGQTIMGWTRVGNTQHGGWIGSYSQGSINLGNGQEHILDFNGMHNGASFAQESNSIVADMGDNTNTGYAWHQNPSTTANDGNWHHLAITYVLNGNVASRVIRFYVDGVLEIDTAAWVKPFNDAFGVYTFQDAALTIPACARKITTGCPGACTYTDFLDGELEDGRIYTRALTAAEVLEVYRQRGRDGMRNGLLRRWDWTVDCRDLGPNGIACTPQNGPTFTATTLLGVRRR